MLPEQEGRDPTVTRRVERLKAVILCGGQGTRLREETEYRPKPLVTPGTPEQLKALFKRIGMTPVALPDSLRES